MKKRNLLIWLLLAVVIAEGIFCIRCVRNHDHADIDKWSSDLTALAVEHAEVARGYGIEKVAYAVPAYEYDGLLELLEKAVTEDNCSRTEKARRSEEDYRLAFQYNGRLWLFKCCEDERVSLTFEYVETAAYYGCGNGTMYIHSPELWHYIVDTVDTKAIPKTV